MENGAGQQEVTLEALLDAAQVSAADVCVIRAADDPAGTAAAIDEATRDVPPLVIVTADDERAAAHADAWGCDHDGWLVLADPPGGNAVLAPLATLAGAAMPGNWRGGRRPAAAMQAHSARAALVDTSATKQTGCAPSWSRYGHRLPPWPNACAIHSRGVGHSRADGAAADLPPAIAGPTRWPG